MMLKLSVAPLSNSGGKIDARDMGFGFSR